MEESLEEWATKPTSAWETIKSYVFLALFFALLFTVFANPRLLLFCMLVFVLFSFGVIPIPRGAEEKRKDVNELAKRVEDLQWLYPQTMHMDWPFSQSEWDSTRSLKIEERAESELKAERREKSDFPWNIPWWGRVLCCVPWFIDGIFFFSDRMWGWPIWR